MKGPLTSEPIPAVTCPSCGGTSAHPFSFGGVCLQCAGERVFSGADFSLPPPLEHTGSTPGLIGENIGPYSIVEEIGRGGMGRVYAARQPGLGRIVALKALPEGCGGVAGLELRFLREAQTAAQLRHPHIVSVHDSGRANGYVYFSMDYIDGGDLARRLREKEFSPRDSAILLLKVAKALSYTHSQGVLHRDLKPSNILLDGDEPRLADFGLAAQLEPGGDLTAATGVIGTPHYVAPEALRYGSGSLSAASDLYALGVILYEMLTGRTPYAGASPATLATLIEECDPAPLRLLSPSVPPDLETICLKCLERDPGRRYESAAALAVDLQRFLAGEPIVATAPGAWAAFAKSARRHRVALAATAAIAVVLLAATALSVTQAIRATRAEKAAAAEAQTSRALVEFLRNDLLAQASPDNQPDRDIKLRTVLERAAAKIDGRFAAQPLVEADIRETLAMTHDSLGDFATEERMLRRGLELRQRVLGPQHPQTLALASQLAICLASQGKLEEAGRMGDATCAELERTLGAENVATIHAFNNQVYIDKALGRLAAAEALARRALALARRALGPDHEETRVALSNLSSNLWAQGRLPEAEALNVEALAAFLRTRGPEHPETLSVMSNLASVYWSEGKLAEAEKMNLQILDTRRRVLGQEHPETLRSMNNLATVYAAETKWADAEALHAKNLEIRTRVLGPDHADTLSALHNLAQVYQSEGRSAEAIALCAKARDTAIRVLGPDHYLTLNISDTLAIFYFNTGHPTEGEAISQVTIAGFQRISGPDNARTIAARETLASGLATAGRLAESEAVWRDVLARREKTAPTAWRTQAARSQLGDTLAAQRRFGEAEPLLLESHAGLQRVAGTIPPNQLTATTKAAERIVRLYTNWDRPAQADEWRTRLAANAR